MPPHILILHNIRSNHNVGSLFRIADCVGISKIVLSGYTPTPIDLFGRVVKEIAKTALGAEKSVAWEKVSTLKNIVQRLKKETYEVVAIEQDKKSLDYKKYKVKNPIAFVLGNEVEGLSSKEKSLCDVCVEIPMKGEKESLNVSIAGAVVLFRVLGI